MRLSLKPPPRLAPPAGATPPRLAFEGCQAWLVLSLVTVAVNGDSSNRDKSVTGPSIMALSHSRDVTAAPRASGGGPGASGGNAKQTGATRPGLMWKQRPIRTEMRRAQQLSDLPLVDI
ncbi:hypothetical protein JEQ12_008602 [Ovis aries]|uniref:Uncharacterized protein n=1 Tax=Ovis aries TaxID=9940 RepID=A0A836CUD2_SHEEP|nr:hypothetical protein JEQ12_008602 [Ovis aries]